jgi:protein TonB
VIFLLLAATLQAAPADPAPTPKADWEEVQEALAQRRRPIDWLRRPPYSEMLAAYPEEARRNGVTGSVVLTCLVTGRGTLTECVVTEETPANYGFGEAAIKLAPQFKMSPTTREGKPVEGGSVRLPIRFHEYRD